MLLFFFFLLLLILLNHTFVSYSYFFFFFFFFLLLSLFGQAHVPIFRLQGPFATKEAQEVCANELWQPLMKRPFMMNFLFAFEARDEQRRDDEVGLFLAAVSVFCLSVCVCVCVCVCISLSIYIYIL